MEWRADAGVRPVRSRAPGVGTPTIPPRRCREQVGHRRRRATPGCRASATIPPGRRAASPARVSGRLVRDGGDRALARPGCQRRGSPRTGRSGICPPDSWPRAAALRPYRVGQRRRADPVGDDAEEHRQGDDRHGLVRGGSELLRRRAARTPGTPGRAGRTSRRTATVCAVEAGADAGPGRPAAIRTTVRLSTAYSTAAQSTPVDEDRYRDRAERQPHQQRHQAAHLLGEDQFGGAAPTGRRAEGQPAAERGDEPVAVRRPGPRRRPPGPGPARRRPRSPRPPSRGRRAQRSSHPPPRPDGRADGQHRSPARAAPRPAPAGLQVLSADGRARPART